MFVVLIGDANALFSSDHFYVVRVSDYLVRIRTADREGQAGCRFLDRRVPSPLLKSVLAFVMADFLGFQSPQVVLKIPNV